MSYVQLNLLELPSQRTEKITIYIRNKLFNWLVKPIKNVGISIHRHLTGWSIWLVLLVIGLLFSSVVYLQSAGQIESYDEYSHFFIARDVLKNGQLLLNEWGRPVNTFFYMIPSLDSIETRRLASIVFSTWTVLIVTFIIKERLQYKYAWAITPLLLSLQPWFYHYGTQSLTQIPFMLVLVAGIWFWLGNQLFAASFLFSLLPLIRLEAVSLTVAWSLYLVLQQILPEKAVEMTRRLRLDLRRTQPFIKNSYSSSSSALPARLVIMTHRLRGIGKIVFDYLRIFFDPNLMTDASQDEATGWVKLIPLPWLPAILIGLTWFPYIVWNWLYGMQNNELPVMRLIGERGTDDYPSQSITTFFTNLFAERGVGLLISVMALLGIIICVWRFLYRTADLNEDPILPNARVIWWIPFVVFFVTHSVSVAFNFVGSGGYHFFVLPIAPFFAIFAAIFLARCYYFMTTDDSAVLQKLLPAVLTLFITALLVGFAATNVFWWEGGGISTTLQTQVIEPLNSWLAEESASKITSVVTNHPGIRYELEYGGLLPQLEEHQWCPSRPWTLNRYIPLSPDLLPAGTLLVFDNIPGSDFSSNALYQDVSQSNSWEYIPLTKGDKVPAASPKLDLQDKLFPFSHVSLNPAFELIFTTLFDKEVNRTYIMFFKKEKEKINNDISSLYLRHYCGDHLVEVPPGDALPLVVTTEKSFLYTTYSVFRNNYCEYIDSGVIFPVLFRQRYDDIELYNVVAPNRELRWVKKTEVQQMEQTEDYEVLNLDRIQATLLPAPPPFKSSRWIRPAEAFPTGKPSHINCEAFLIASHSRPRK